MQPVVLAQSSAQSGSVSRGRRLPVKTGTANFAQVLAVSAHLTSGSKRGPRERASSLPFEQWPAWRRGGAKVLESSVYDYIMAAVVLANVVVMVIETNQNAACEGQMCTAPFIHAFNWVCLATYTLEVLLRFAVYRLSMFCDSWCVADIVVVVMGILEMAMSTTAQTQNMPKTSSLKAVRVFRLLRAMKFVQYIPALRNIVRGFVSALSAMLWGIVTIMVLVFLVSIATVELVHPITEHINFGPADDEWCKTAFSSVQLAMLFFTQIVIAGDAWGACVIPLARYNGGFWLLFAGVTVMVQLGVMNLVLTAIVGSADRAHECDLEARGRELHEQDLTNIQILGDIFATMDAEDSGILSEGDFFAAYDGNPEMQKLFKLLNVGRANLIPFFRLMDQDRSGTINYDEFLTTMRDAQLTDWRMQMMTVKLQTAHAIQLLEEAHGIPEPCRVHGSTCLQGGRMDGTSSQASSRPNEASSESPRDHMKKAADDEKRATPSKVPSRANRKSLRAIESPCDTEKVTKKLSFVDAEEREPFADADGLPVVGDGSGLALDDDFKTFLDTAVANLDEELRMLRKSLHHAFLDTAVANLDEELRALRKSVEDVIAATLSRTAPSSKRLLPLRRDLAGYESSMDGSGLRCVSEVRLPCSIRI